MSSGKALSVVGIILLASFGLGAQEAPRFPLQPNTVYVGAQGKYEAEPDTAVVRFNISAQEETSKAAYDRGARAAEQVRQVLRSNGLDPKQAEISMFSLEPVYDYRSPQRRLLGYRANASVAIKLKDFGKVAPLVQQFTQLDVTAEQSVHYELDDIDAAKQRAVEDAYQRARALAETIARSGGRALGPLTFATVDVQEPVGIVPMMQMRTMTAEAAAPPAPTEGFSPQKITVHADLKALFALELK